ncbi:helix-turn-helix domain-containing protein [Flavobacteriaceae bacterium Ap0902]|nr:helix-turn-helix domain-containing protein [Flavobacteriaceae bacterium Ap0902]
MKKNAVLEDPLFQNLSVREKSTLQANSSVVSFDDTEMFLKKGTFLFSIYYVNKGVIKIKGEDNRMLDLLGPQNVIGLNHLFKQEPIFFSAYGIENTEIIQIERNVLKNFINTNPKFLEDIYNKAIENPELLIRNVIAYRNHNITGALASFLIYYNEKDCLHALTQKEISEILGYSRENVSRCLNTFQQSKYIKCNDGSIEVLDMSALSKFQQFG